MTRAEQIELDALAKDVSIGTDGRFPPDAYPFLREVAATLHRLAWAPSLLCLMCPRNGSKHACSCPHNQAKKRLVRFGVWPEEA